MSPSPKKHTSEIVNRDSNEPNCIRKIDRNKLEEKMNQTRSKSPMTLNEKSERPSQSPTKEGTFKVRSMESTILNQDQIKQIISW